MSRTYPRYPGNYERIFWYIDRAPVPGSEPGTTMLVARELKREELPPWTGPLHLSDAKLREKFSWSGREISFFKAPNGTPLFHTIIRRDAPFSSIDPTQPSPPMTA